MIKKKFKNILVTGGFGFIGSNFIHYLARNKLCDRIINLDNMTYAANDLNLLGCKCKGISVVDDIVNRKNNLWVLQQFDIDLVVNFAAETHVDTSIIEPDTFVKTNVLGVCGLLEAIRDYDKNVHFHQVSTDEVYGYLQIGEKSWTETSPYNPSSPYSASKAGADHLVRAYYKTYGLPVTISNGCNTYGPRQHKEKLIPLMISNIFNRKQLPIYGDGSNIREWIYVDDHCSGIWAIIVDGEIGESYNIGTSFEINNLDLVNVLCSVVDKKYGTHDSKSLIAFVEDRLGHDFRYSLDSSKLLDLGWFPKTEFMKGIIDTIDWYSKR